MREVLDLSLFALPKTLDDSCSSLTTKQPVPPSSTMTSVDQQIHGGEFLAGPIRMEWIEAAARLPGAALPVALLVRHLYVLRGQDWVVLSNAAVKRFSVSSSAKGRAVEVLEEAGLIEVQDRRAGRAYRVRPIGDSLRAIRRLRTDPTENQNRITQP
ncbi:hypothetical protein SLH49_00825 [Cognatiyoonia sp. IB215446]|uniref:hypothetical protein n=1 Tax=Cognatiyoonia sp. IB215446 TaxID=3097355 RepID=UPI002A1019CF|nr:hypothetical protein [Cognatiyoonia sp. IB215446]MDX8346512.1 hypothetical protein [Cognatiyoonia sp. IB215446]